MVGISSWNMILISNDFWHKIKMYNFDSYNVLLTKYSCAAYDCFCAPGTHLLKPGGYGSLFHHIMNK